MKQISSFNRLFFYRFIFLVVLILSGTANAIGQLDIDVDIDKKEWYEQPWAWVVGAALFILILVALLRRPRK